MAPHLGIVISLHASVPISVTGRAIDRDDRALTFCENLIAGKHAPVTPASARGTRGLAVVGTEQATVREDYHALVRTDVIPYVPRLGGTLLDVGGGIGATAARLKSLGNAERVGVIDAVDGTGGSGQRPAIDFSHVGDIEDQEFMASVLAKEGPFNTILCLDVLEHLVDPWRLVAQLHAALAPQGVIVASVPNVRNYTALGPLLFKNQWQLLDAGILDRTHLRFFVRSSAIELMTRSGLELVSVHPAPGGGRKVRLIRALTFGLFNSFTDRQYVICVRRSAQG
jgi:2-polyprenyl-3-methyl-5-hydroxy-6-metoxy-1,4-benzoquinol methylase